MNRLRPTTGVLAGILAGVVSVTLWAGAPALAVADEPAANGPIELLDQPKPPTEQAKSAARRVQAYLEETPKPARPGADASAAEREVYGAAALRWMQGFPFAAGWAQWNCTAISWSFWRAPSADAGLDHIEAEYVFECLDGYIPSWGDVFIARPDAINPAVSLTAQEMDCLRIRDGDHCFTEGTDPISGAATWNTSYYWQGTGSMTGRYRVGSVPAIWPACSDGAIIRTGLLMTLAAGRGGGYVNTPAPGTVKSLIWDEADENGNITGMRSMRCLLEPTSSSAGA